MTTTYSLTSRLWPNEGLLEVYDRSGARLAGVSIEFLRQGCVSSWEYVEYAVSCCVVESGRVYNEDGSELERSRLPARGTYLFLRSGEMFEIEALLGPVLFEDLMSDCLKMV